MHMLDLLWLYVSLDQLFRPPKPLAHLDCSTLLNKLPYLKICPIFPMQFKEMTSSENIPHRSHCKNLLQQTQRP